MNNNKYKSLIHTLVSLTEIPTDEIDKIEKLFYPVKISKGDYFVKNGDLSKTIGFIVSGLFRYFYSDKNGIEYTKYFASENNFVISYSSLLLSRPSRFSIEALENSEILCIRYSDWLNLVDGNICWQIVTRKVIEKVYVIKEIRESELLLEDAQSRYKNFMESYPGLNKRIKQYHIASYLGISPVSLSRIRKNFSNN